jgi:hypothetical protein
MSTNPLNETQSHTDAVARTLTTAVEHGQSIAKELDAMTPSEKVQIAHKMEEYNRADRSNNDHLPRLNITFVNDFAATDIHTPAQPGVKNQEHLDAIEIEKHPEDIFFKNKQDVYKNPKLGEEMVKSLMDQMDPKMKAEYDRVAAERKKIEDNFSPEQKRQYAKEQALMDAWLEDRESDNKHFGPRPFGETLPKKPLTPLHDAVQRITNKDGKTDWDMLGKPLELEEDHSWMPRW